MNSQVRNNLFQKYCTSFYGTQILPPLLDVNIQSLYTAWRIAIRRVWRIPWTTHNEMLAHIAGVIDPEYWFAKRCIRFIKMANLTITHFELLAKWVSTVHTLS